jgi:hypothetical protein
VPFDTLVKPVCSDAKLRRLVRNMIYPGILARLLGLDPALMEKALGKQLEVVVLNAAALKAGFDYAEATFTKQDPFIEPMNETAGKILIEGNAAAAIGCMMASPLSPGIRSRRPRRCAVADRLHEMPRRQGARRRSRSCRPKTRSRRSAW